MGLKSFIAFRLAKLCQNYRRKKLYKQIVNEKHDVSSVDKKNTFDARKYGFSFSQSKAFQLNKHNVKDYISTWESYQPRIKNTKYSLVADEKMLFSLVFQKFVTVPKNIAVIKQGTIYAIENNNVSNENIYEFLMEMKGGVIKDSHGYNGYGVYIFNVKDNTLYLSEKPITREELATLISSTEDSLIQTKLEQGQFENQFFDKTINTIRMVTVKKKDSLEHEIIGALQRIGTKRSLPVDNFAQGGGTSIIDLETGELSAMTCLDSFNEKGERLFFDTHPDSGAQIKGVKIPDWKKVKEYIVELTKNVPLFNYAAWDIVLQDNGAIGIIEVNMKSSLDVFQVHGGMRNTTFGEKYKEYGYI